MSVILRIFHCACAKRPYFHFRSKIWRHHRVPRPRFPLRRVNFGDSRTFKADILLLNICMGFQDLLAKNGVLGGKIGEWVVRYWPPMNSFLPFRVLTSVPILVKIDQEMRPWECPQTDRHTDANRFYNLSHAICYSYGTDKNRWMQPRRAADCRSSFSAGLVFQQDDVPVKVAQESMVDCAVHMLSTSCPNSLDLNHVRKPMLQRYQKSHLKQLKDFNLAV